MRMVLCERDGFSEPQPVPSMGRWDADVRIAAGPGERVRPLSGGDAIYLSDSPDGTAFPRPCRLALPEPGPVQIRARQIGPDGVAQVIALWYHGSWPIEASRIFHLAIP